MTLDNIKLACLSHIFANLTLLRVTPTGPCYSYWFVQKKTGRENCNSREVEIHGSYRQSTAYQIIAPPR